MIGSVDRSGGGGGGQLQCKILAQKVLSVYFLKKK